MKRFGIALLVLLVPTVLLAQTPTATLRWDYAATLAEVQTVTQSITIDGTAVTTAPTCTAINATSTTCSVVAPQLATGSHTVVVTATKGGQSSELRVTGLGGASVPQPGNPRLVITVTVAIGS